MKHRLLSVFLLSLFAATTHAARISLDLRPSAAPGAQTLAAAPGSAEKGVMRSSRLGAGAANVSGLAVGDQLRIRVYDDVTLDLKLEMREEAPLSGPVFHASVAGAKWLNAVVMETGEGLLVNATDRSGLVYTIVSSVNGVSVREIDPNAEPVFDAPALVPEAYRSAESDLPVMPFTAPGDQASTVVDMLVAYDTPAAAWARQNAGGITNLAQACVSKMNTALENNGLSATFRFRLVGVIAVNANGNGNFDDTLGKVTNGTGSWAAVNAMREDVGADVVSTMIDTGTAYGTTGLGWSLTSTTAQSIRSFANSAYNVLAVRAANQSYVMAHETGHNMGAGHSDMQTSGPGPQSWNYSRGYYFTGTDNVAYHTVMAYNSDGHGNSYTQAPLFSDPDNTWAGVAAGNSTHDNAQVLLNTYQYVSQFRTQKIPLSYDVFFSPEAGSLFSGSLQVSLTPGKAGLTIRYTTDGSTPTASHGTVYSSPFTITATTTVKAVTINNGVAGPVYESTYFVSNLGYALNAPQLAWNTSSDYPWTVQTDTTYDGLAVQSTDGGGYWNQSSWLSATITGPTKMSFRYKFNCYSTFAYFAVTSDNVELFRTTSKSDSDWTQVEVSIPSGSHVVKFNSELTGGRTSGFNGVWLDTIQFDALSRPPVMSPVTTTDASTATIFNRTLSVTLTPGTVGGHIFYTLDDSDPAGETGIPYEGPIVLTSTTLVRAVEVDPAKEVSAEVSGLYVERHPIAPGEWTTDVDGAQTAAASDGKLILVLLANRSSCGHCQALYPLAHSQTFLMWARDNGVYLVTADASLHPDADDALSYFWALRGDYGDPMNSASYATMYFALPNNPETAVARGIAQSGNTIGTVTYSVTVETLIAGIASVLSANGYTPGPVTPPSPADIFGTTGVEWTNNSSVQWRELYPNQMKAGGLMSSTFTSVLTAHVSGKGKFIFSYEAVSYTWQNISEFEINGTQSFNYCYDGTITRSGTITNDVTSASGATFRWTCIVGDSSRDYGAGYSPPCGFTIYNVQWIPESPPQPEGVERDDGQGNMVMIPKTWFVAQGLVSASATQSDLSNAADADADGDGLVNWAEYLCGTDPNDASKKLICTISIVEGVPVPDYSPKTGCLSGYGVVIKGKTSLNDSQWQSKTSTHRFFKAFVEKE